MVKIERENKKVRIEKAEIVKYMREREKEEVEKIRGIYLIIHKKGKSRSRKVE